MPFSAMALSAARVSEDAVVPPAAKRGLTVAAVLVVMLVYALPLVAAYTFQHRLLYAETPDDSFYETRVLELVRGGTLSNPYMPEHANAPRYMPELVERVLAGSIRATHMDPLRFIALTRVFFPAAIFLLVCRLARGLDLEPPTALLAGCLAVFAPSLSLGGYTLRYFRVISPAAHILIVMLVLLLVQRAWRSPGLYAAGAAGAGIGLLFYTLVYYWSFILLGVGLLALLASGRARRALIASGVLALLLGSPSLLNSARLSSDPVVRDTLARLKLMVPGRAPEPDVLPRLLIGLCLVSVAWWFRRKHFRWAAFVLPFAIAASFMLVQNVVTNRQFQAYHMINCLMPLAAFVVAGSLQALRLRTWAYAAIGLLIVAGATAQISGYKAWLRHMKREPAQYALSAAFPHTLAWLNQETPRHAAVVFPETMATAAPLFTLNRVYLVHYAYQYVVPSSELLVREEARENWSPGKTLPYRADYVLEEGVRCRQWSAAAVFRDVTEDTCIFQLHP